MRDDLMWTCLVWAERSTPDSSCSFPSHRFNSATGEQKGITQTIYTDPEPPSLLPNSLMPSAKLRSANLPFFNVFGVTRSGVSVSGSVGVFGMKFLPVDPILFLLSLLT